MKNKIKVIILILNDIMNSFSYIIVLFYIFYKGKIINVRPLLQHIHEVP